MGEAANSERSGRTAVGRGGCIGYLGKISDHSENLAHQLRSRDIDLVAIQDSSSSGVYTRQTSYAGRLRSRTSRLAAQLWGTADAAYKETLVKAVDSTPVDTVIAYWGTNPLCDIIALKKIRPNVKVVLNVLCHPTAIDPVKVALQNWLLRRSLHYCDGIIASSIAMKDYLERRVLRGHKIPILICPPYLSGVYQPQARSSSPDSSPSALFLGRMDWRRGQPSDDVSADLHRLMSLGIDVYHHADNQSSNASEHSHTFPYMSLPEAIKFSTQFDVSLIMYNLGACRARERFSVTVPDRLVASVAAGIPIALPSLGYEACREYLKGYRAVLLFQSIEHLAEQLSDRARMAELKQHSLEDHHAYVAENHIDRLLQFVDCIGGNRDRGLSCRFEGAQV